MFGYTTCGQMLESVSQYFQPINTVSHLTYSLNPSKVPNAWTMSRHGTYMLKASWMFQSCFTGKLSPKVIFAYQRSSQRTLQDKDFFGIILVSTHDPCGWNLPKISHLPSRERAQTYPIPVLPHILKSMILRFFPFFLCESCIHFLESGTCVNHTPPHMKSVVDLNKKTR